MSERTPRHISIFRSADRVAHGEAFKELLTVSGISAIPFLIGAVAYVVSRENAGQAANVGQYFSAVLLQGQLFLISVSYVATSLYRLWNSAHSYERPDVIAGFSLLLFGVIGVFYGLNPEFANLTSDFTRTMSLFFFVMSIMFYYYTAVLAYYRPKKIAQALADDVNELGNRLSRRRSRNVEEDSHGA